MSGPQMSPSAIIFLPSAALLNMDIERNETEKIDGDFAAARNLNGDLWKVPLSFKGLSGSHQGYCRTPCNLLYQFQPLDPTPEARFLRLSATIRLLVNDKGGFNRQFVKHPLVSKKTTEMISRAATSKSFSSSPRRACNNYRTIFYRLFYHPEEITHLSCWAFEMESNFNFYQL